MENFLSAVVLIVSSIVLVFMNIFFWKSCRRLILRTSSNTFFVDLLFSLFGLRVTLYYLLPAITHLLLNWKNQDIERVLPSEVSIVYIVEVFSHFIYYIVFYKKVILKIYIFINKWSKEKFIPTFRLR